MHLTSKEVRLFLCLKRHITLQNRSIAQAAYTFQSSLLILFSQKKNGQLPQKRSPQRKDYDFYKFPSQPLAPKRHNTPIKHSTEAPHSVEYYKPKPLKCPVYELQPFLIIFRNLTQPTQSLIS